jgi:hypothetical protein
MSPSVTLQPQNRWKYTSSSQVQPQNMSFRLLRTFFFLQYWWPSHTGITSNKPNIGKILDQYTTKVTLNPGVQGMAENVFNFSINLNLQVSVSSSMLPLRIFQTCLIQPYFCKSITFNNSKLANKTAKCPPTEVIPQTQKFFHITFPFKINSNIYILKTEWKKKHYYLNFNTTSSANWTVSSSDLLQ